MFQLVPLLLFLTYWRDAMAQRQSKITTDVVCGAEFAWMTSEKGQSPCLLAAHLIAPCSVGEYTVSALQPGNMYSAPSTETANDCRCSWAVFNLMSACSACQDRLFHTWIGWTVNCPSSALSNAPYTSRVSLPRDISIPAWAVLNATDYPGDKWDIIAAETFARQDYPDIVPPAIGRPEDGSSGSNGEDQASTPLGAIVGGVVGGLAVLGLAGLAIWLYRRKQIQNQAPPPHTHRPRFTSKYSFSGSSQTSHRHMRSDGSIRTHATLIASPITPAVGGGNSPLPSPPLIQQQFFTHLTAPQVPNLPQPQTPSIRSSSYHSPQSSLDSTNYGQITPFILPPNRQPSLVRRPSADRVSDKTVQVSVTPPSPSAAVTTAPAQPVPISSPDDAFLASSRPRAQRYNPPAYSESDLGHSIGRSATPATMTTIAEDATQDQDGSSGRLTLGEALTTRRVHKMAAIHSREQSVASQASSEQQ